MEDKKSPKSCVNCMIRLPLFNLLTDEQLENINLTRCEVRFHAGETIFKQGTVMTHFIIITEGLVKGYIEGLNNSNLILGFFNPISMIGGPGFLTDYKHHITTTAMEETSACFIEINALSNALKENSAFSLELLRCLNLVTQNHYIKFIELTQKGMHGRIATALLYLFNDIFKEGDRTIRIKRQDLADLTAMSKESAIRIIKEFKDEKTITVEGNAIILNDLLRLAKISLMG